MVAADLASDRGHLDDRGRWVDASPEETAAWLRRSEREDEALIDLFDHRSDAAGRSDKIDVDADADAVDEAVGRGMRRSDAWLVLKQGTTSTGGGTRYSALLDTGFEPAFLPHPPAFYRAVRRFCSASCSIAAARLRRCC